MNLRSAIPSGMVRSYIFLMMLIGFGGCAGDVTRDEKQDSGKIKEHLVNANRIFVESESAQIDAYLERHRLTMKTTGTGLRYLLLKQSPDGLHPEPEDTVFLNYEVSLLDGTPCYNTKGIPIEFTLGKAEMPRGMEEAVSMMKPGDSCVAVLPSHLAYGFTGDGDRIPGNAATVYYISLVKISKSVASKSP